MSRDIKKDLLVTLSDSNFIDQAKQLFSSVYFNSGWDGDYMLLAHNIPENKLKWFKDKEILVKECKPLSRNDVFEHSGVILDKLYLFSEEFKQWEHVVFLDSDMIVKASLKPLTKIRKLAAVNARIKLSEQFFPGNNLYEELSEKYNLRKKSFNSGLLAFPTNIIKKNTFNELMDLYQQYKHISKCNEESILNLYFYNNWQSLPGVYNYFVSVIMITNMKLNKIKAVIYHFISIQDFDEYRAWHPENLYFKEWQGNLKKSDLINLNSRPAGKKITAIVRLINSLLISLLFEYIKDRYIKDYFNRKIGDIVHFIKNISPALYSKLKKLKNGK